MCKRHSRFMADEMDAETTKGLVSQGAHVCFSVSFGRLTGSFETGRGENEG